MIRTGRAYIILFLVLHWLCPPGHAISEKAFGEKVEKLTSMTDKFHAKFVKPFNADGAKALDVLKNLVKNPMNFVAISSLIGSALSFVALSPDSLPLTVGKFNEAMKKLHGAIGDLQRHLDRRLDQLERLMVELSIRSEIFTPIKSMMEKTTLFASNPRIHMGHLEASCNATGWTLSDLRNKFDSVIEHIPVLSKRGASTRAGLEEVTEYFLAALMDLQFLTGVCNGIAYKRTGASTSEIQRDAEHHGAKMAAIERRISEQDGRIMASYFPDVAYEIAREIMKNGGSNEDMANRISQKLSKDYSPDVFIVGVYDAARGWGNHGISEHYAQSTLFKLDHQVDGGLFGKHLLIHRASGEWGFKPACDFGGVVDKLADKEERSRGWKSNAKYTETTATRDLRNAMNYVVDRCRDSVSFVAFVRFGNGLRVRGSMPDDGWQFENIQSVNTYSMVIGLKQSDQRVRWISAKSSQTSADNVQIDIDTLIEDIHATFIESSGLNTPIRNSVFTFYGASGRGACGLDVTPCSAAASEEMFETNGRWVPSSLPDRRYILDDSICRGICVKVDYKGKTAVFPVDNKCTECPKNHVVLSDKAFLVLEPRGGAVGRATGATITYVRCDQHSVSSCPV